MLAITGMTVCALVGSITVVGFIAVRWPGNTGRYLVGVLVASVVGFMASASTAVFTAARETYPRVEKLPPAE